MKLREINPEINPVNILDNLIHCTPKEAVGELVNNSFDANATKVYVKLGQYNGQAAIFFMDDGDGFSYEGIEAFLGYGKTTRVRGDKKTVGANGMGTKSALIFGDIKSVKITVITRSKDFPVGVKTSFDYDQLIKLFKHQLSGESLLDRTVSNNLGEFYQGWKPREKGSTVIITNFTKIRSNEDLEKLLSERLSPRTADKVFVWKNKSGRYALVQPTKMSGQRYNHEYESELLGKVTFDVYHGGTNDGPMICGQYNSITEFAKFATTLSQSDRTKMKSIWKSIGGYIYIPYINKYRLNNGSFLPEFKTDGACAELVSMFALIAEELEKFQEEIKTDKAFQEQKEFIRFLTEVSRGKDPEYPPFSKASSGKLGIPQPMQFGSMDIPVFLVPKQVTIPENESLAICLMNQGSQQLNLKQVAWYSPHKDVTVTGYGQRVTVSVGSKKDIGDNPVIITAKGEFGEHNVRVIVVKPSDNPYISGSKLLNPGAESDYTLNNSKESVHWELSKCSGVTVVANRQDSRSATLNVAKGAVAQTVTLFALSDRNNGVVAQISIKITDLTYNASPKIKIGDDWFIIEFSSRYPAPVQVEEPSEELGLPMLYVNSLHPLMRDMPKSVWSEVIVNGMAFAAAGYSIQYKNMSTQMAINNAWEYVELIKLFMKKK